MGKSAAATIGIGEAAKVLGRTRKTLLTWEREGKLVPVSRDGGRKARVYRVADVTRIRDERTLSAAVVLSPELSASATPRAEVLDAMRVLVQRGVASTEHRDALVAIAAARVVLEFAPVETAAPGVRMLGSPSWLVDDEANDAAAGGDG